MKIKTIILFVIAFFAAFMVITQSTIMARELNNDEYDKIFMDTINNLATENYNGNIEISATKEVLYDLELDTIGYVYDFKVNEESGYAILINSNFIQVNEIYFNATNPYNNNNVKIYVSNMKYIEYIPAENLYRWAGSTKIIDTKTLNALKKVALYSGGNISSSSVTINFISKSDKEYVQAKRYPDGCQVGGLSNACVAIAAANIVHYWDRYNDNLIADFIPGTVLGNYYLYKNNPDIHAKITNELYSNMHMANYEGITINQFKSGFATYCQNRNYNVTYISCMSDNKFDFEYVKQKIEIGDPIMLFVDIFTASEINQYDKSDMINSIIVDGSHAMAAFGYREITYRLQNNTEQKDAYLAVSTGLVNMQRGYCNLANMTIDDSYAVHVA